MFMENNELYGIKGIEKVRGKFKHPWFFESTYKKCMDDFSDEFVYLRHIDTGIIFEFKLYYYSHYGHNKEHKPNCLLVTTTEGDTMFIPKNGDVEKAMLRILKQGAPKASKTASNGIVTYGQSYFRNWTNFQQTLNACGFSISPKTVELLWQELEARQKLKKEG